jgi:hypothetical protein
VERPSSFTEVDLRTVSWAREQPEVGRRVRERHGAPDLAFPDALIVDPTRVAAAFREAALVAVETDAPAGVAERMLLLRRLFAARAEALRTEPMARQRLAGLVGLRDGPELVRALADDPDLLGRVRAFAASDLVTLAPDESSTALAFVLQPDPGVVDIVTGGPGEGSGSPSPEPVPEGPPPDTGGEPAVDVAVEAARAGAEIGLLVGSQLGGEAAATQGAQIGGQVGSEATGLFSGVAAGHGGADFGSHVGGAVGSAIQGPGGSQVGSQIGGELFGAHHPPGSGGSGGGSHHGLLDMLVHVGAGVACGWCQAFCPACVAVVEEGGSWLAHKVEEAVSSLFG